MERKEQLINELRSLTEQTDNTPNKSEVVASVETNTREIIEIFGSYKDWCQAAGLKRTRGHTQKWTIDAIEAALQKASTELDGYLTFESYQSWHEQSKNIDTTPAASTIKRIMDYCWADCLRYFKLVPVRSKSTPLLSEGDIKSSLLDVTDGKYMSMREYDRERDRDMPSATTIAHWYKGWPKAFEYLAK